MITEKRKVFLFGAGAVLKWRGPQTSCLTHLIRQSGFPIADRSMTVTELLYRTLTNKDKGLKNIVNFETIISAIEELIIHYANLFEWEDNPFKESHFPNFHRLLFHTTLTKKIFGKSIGELMVIKKIGKDGLNYIKINETWIKDRLKDQENNETSEQYLLRILLIIIYEAIYNRVEKYNHDFNQKDNTKIHNPTVSCLNNSFAHWMNGIKNESSIIRMYSLNYDDIFKVILEQQNSIKWEIFDGFEAHESSLFGRSLDLDGLHHNNQTDCYYNLHGSTNWRIEKRYPTGTVLPFQKSNFDICKSMQNVRPDWSNLFSYYIPVETGRPILISPLISGYQKSERLALTPFRQMYSAFDRDCFTANEIYIIGYSLGDEHINDSIRTAFVNNQNTKVYIIDPVYKFQIECDRVAIDNIWKLNTLLFNVDGNISFKKENDELYSIGKGRVKIHPINFEDFLNKLN